MIQEVTKYKTFDGSLFDSETEQHVDNLIGQAIDNLFKEYLGDLGHSGKFSTY